LDWTGLDKGNYGCGWVTVGYNNNCTAISDRIHYTGAKHITYIQKRHSNMNRAITIR